MMHMSRGTDGFLPSEPIEPKRAYYTLDFQKSQRNNSEHQNTTEIQKRKRGKGPESPGSKVRGPPKKGTLTMGEQKSLEITKFLKEGHSNENNKGGEEKYEKYVNGKQKFSILKSRWSSEAINLLGHFSSLSKKVKYSIFGYLDEKTLMQMQLVCKKTRKIAFNIGKARFESIFGPMSKNTIEVESFQCLNRFFSKRPNHLFSLFWWTIERGYDRPLTFLLSEIHKRIIEREIIQGSNNGVIELNIKYLFDHLRRINETKTKYSIASDLTNNHNFKMAIYSDVINHRIEYKKNATPFWLSCLYGRETIFRYLELLNPYINTCDLNMNSCLYVAIQNGNRYIIMRLLDLQCNCGIINSNGWTPLMLACYQGMHDVAQRIFEKLNVVNSLENHKAFAIACHKGLETIVRLLVQNGLHINTLAYHGRPPLVWACLGGHLPIVKFLIENGAEVNYVKEQICPLTPLMAACQEGHTQIVSYLLEAGASPGIVNKHKQNALFIAVKNNFIDIVEILLKYYKPSKEEVISIITKLKGRINPKIIDMLKMSCGLPLDKANFKRLLDENKRKNKLANLRKKMNFRSISARRPRKPHVGRFRSQTPDERDEYMTDLRKDGCSACSSRGSSRNREDVEKQRPKTAQPTDRKVMGFSHKIREIPEFHNYHQGQSATNFITSNIDALRFAKFPPPKNLNQSYKTGCLCQPQFKPKEGEMKYSYYSHAVKESSRNLMRPKSASTQEMFDTSRSRGRSNKDFAFSINVQQKAEFNSRSVEELEGVLGKPKQNCISPQHVPFTISYNNLELPIMKKLNKMLNSDRFPGNYGSQRKGRKRNIGNTGNTGRGNTGSVSGRLRSCTNSPPPVLTPSGSLSDMQSFVRFWNIATEGRKEEDREDMGLRLQNKLMKRYEERTGRPHPHKDWVTYPSGRHSKNKSEVVIPQAESWADLGDSQRIGVKIRQFGDQRLSRSREGRRVQGLLGEGNKEGFIRIQQSIMRETDTVRPTSSHIGERDRNGDRREFPMSLPISHSHSTTNLGRPRSTYSWRYPEVRSPSPLPQPLPLTLKRFNLGSSEEVEKVTLKHKYPKRVRPQSAAVKGELSRRMREIKEDSYLLEEDLVEEYKKSFESTGDQMDYIYEDKEEEGDIDHTSFKGRKGVGFRSRPSTASCRVGGQGMMTINTDALTEQRDNVAKNLESRPSTRGILKNTIDDNYFQYISPEGGRTLPTSHSEEPFHNIPSRSQFPTIKEYFEGSKLPGVKEKWGRDSLLRNQGKEKVVNQKNISLDPSSSTASITPIHEILGVNPSQIKKRGMEERKLVNLLEKRRKVADEKVTIKRSIKTGKAQLVNTKGFPDTVQLLPRTLKSPQGPQKRNKTHPSKPLQRPQTAHVVSRSVKETPRGRQEALNIETRREEWLPQHIFTPMTSRFSSRPHTESQSSPWYPSSPQVGQRVGKATNNLPLKGVGTGGGGTGTGGGGTGTGGGGMGTGGGGTGTGTGTGTSRGTGRGIRPNSATTGKGRPGTAKVGNSWKGSKIGGDGGKGQLKYRYPFSGKTGDKIGPPIFHHTDSAKSLHVQGFHTARGTAVEGTTPHSAWESTGYSGSVGVPYPQDNLGEHRMFSSYSTVFNQTTPITPLSTGTKTVLMKMRPSVDSFQGDDSSKHATINAPTIFETGLATDRTGGFMDAKGYYRKPILKKDTQQQRAKPNDSFRSEASDTAHKDYILKPKMDLPTHKLPKERGGPKHSDNILRVEGKHPQPGEPLSRQKRALTSQDNRGVNQLSSGTKFQFKGLEKGYAVPTMGYSRENIIHGNFTFHPKLDHSPKKASKKIQKSSEKALKRLLEIRFNTSGSIQENMKVEGSTIPGLGGTSRKYMDNEQSSEYISLSEQKNREQHLSHTISVRSHAKPSNASLTQEKYILMSRSTADNSQSMGMRSGSDLMNLLRPQIESISRNKDIPNYPVHLRKTAPAKKIVKNFKAVQLPKNATQKIHSTSQGQNVVKPFMYIGTN